jgi:hypothetical protein
MYVFIVYESVFIQVFTFVQLIYTLECWSVLRSIRYKNKKNKKTVRHPESGDPVRNQNASVPDTRFQGPAMKIRS